MNKYIKKILDAFLSHPISSAFIFTMMAWCLMLLLVGSIMAAQVFPVMWVIVGVVLYIIMTTIITWILWYAFKRIFD